MGVGVGGTAVGSGELVGNVVGWLVGVAGLTAVIGSTVAAGATVAVGSATTVGTRVTTGGVMVITVSPRLHAVNIINNKLPTSKNATLLPNKIYLPFHNNGILRPL